MCSIGEDDFGDDGGVHAMIPDAKDHVDGTLIEEEKSLQQLCNKCRKPGAVYKLPFREAECRECFLLYARHKFRAALGSSKVLPKDAHVILVFDGSPESIVLLDMLHHAQTHNTFKRLHCNATVLYLDDYPLKEPVAKKPEDYEKFMKNMQALLKKYQHFECYIAPLGNVTAVCNTLENFKTLNIEQYVVRNKDEQQLFIGSVKAIKSLTSRQDFVKHQRSKLIAAIAKHFKCQFTLMANISSELASDLLAAVALGRGGSAALDVALVDDRLDDDIKLIRPLKDLNRMEIELYLKAQDLKPLQLNRYGHEKGPTASIQNLTKSFVDNLQQNFSSTVSTVFRTGDKIAVNHDMLKQIEDLKLNDLETLDKYCAFCNSVLDYQDSNTLLAIEFSRVVSELGFTSDKYDELNAKAKQNVKGSLERDYAKKLCHACRNICMDSNKEILL